MRRQLILAAFVFSSCAEEEMDIHIEKKAPELNSELPVKDIFGERSSGRGKVKYSPSGEQKESSTSIGSSANLGEAWNLYQEGNRLILQGMPEQALQKFKSANSIEPSYAPAYRGAGIAIAQLGRLEESANAYRKYLELEPNPPDVDIVLEILEKLQSAAR